VAVIKYSSLVVT